ncbi:SDR family NAD(P)-dependent oxidoreductase [Actinocrispum wychmicini]|uniref:Short-subunit dehydrogenase n=1 Tax=Actinocrispum wychmicini TaxID=1213861 RepID=A0A4R2JBX9_9PSEU|nr:SDR family NAD(P)-dependent oxidoreductase [Actinocrispum wychmicini]TCO55907.1 short-subunit dehydrogenase [Actinocrispum wychmicini]
MRSGMTLAGARVLVTGASSGLGRALSIALAERGARLTVVARREPELSALADQIATAGHPSPHVVVADLTSGDSPRQVAAKALAEMGGVDVLINNAGSHMVDSLINIGDADVARAVFEIHLWAPLALTAALLPTMRGNGAIVNVTATMEGLPAPFGGYYAASKSAFSQATRSLRHELRHTPVRVLEVSPGPNDTPARHLGFGAVPWRTSPPSLPSAAPADTARIVVRALQSGRDRVTHPGFARAPSELPVLGRLITAFVTRRIDTSRPVKEPTP